MHHDEPFAVAAGQPGVFAMGQPQAAILADAVAGWLGRDTVTGYGVRFKDMVRPGDVLALRGTAAAAPDGTRRLELSATREADGTEVLSGWATARV